jgi:transcriptional regulator with XRE-family HTH domain
MISTTPATTPSVTMSEIIEHSGKSLAQIARESDLSLSHVSRLRSHTRLPSVQTAAKLAVVLDVPLATLIQAAAATERPARQRPRPAALQVLKDAERVLTQQVRSTHPKAA